MKTFFFGLLLCTWFMSIGNLSAQSDLVLKFGIWKNNTYLGEYYFNGGPSNIYGLSTPSSISAQLCPGDELRLQNLCSYNGAQHSFNGSVGPGSNNPFGECTIGLTNRVSCSVVTPPANPNGILHLADVTNGTPPTSSLSTYQSWSSWNWGEFKTITLPNYPSSTPYLTISATMLADKVPACGCGGRYYFIGLNMGSINYDILDQDICSGDVVDLDLDPSYTYSNWNPSNPDGTSLTSSQSYTVDITNASGCTINDAFELNLINPDVDLSLPQSLCYGQSIEFTNEDWGNLHSSDNSPTVPMALTINGEIIFDVYNGIHNLPYVIDATNFGAGTLTFEYTYEENGTPCSKTYEMYIYPEIVLNMQSSYAFCSGNFQPIFATSSGIVGQPGVTYIWTQSGVPFSVGTGPFFTPSSYGTYQVRAYDEGGCEVVHTFTVYDPGVGVRPPANIRFCSMTQPAPSVVGWSHDHPFGPNPYSCSWTYTDDNGTTTSIANTSAPYQVPYQGPGTYTVVVSTNGCTETFNITVTDLLQVYNNHFYASFNFTPLWGNQVSCQPTFSLFGANDVWTVTNLSTNTNVSTTPDGAGIKFNYTTGVQYSVKLTRYVGERCQVFINQFTWLDNARKRRDHVTSNAANLTPTSVETFPNPTTGLVNVKLTDAETNHTSIQVLNSLGQAILKKEVEGQNNIEVDLTKETSGVYLIQVINGNTKFTEKIIKE